MSTRILLITQWFDPEPTFKGLLFARRLVAEGYSVEVLTGFPNYPGGKIYPGYRIKMWSQEWIDGVLVTRVPLYPSHNQSALGRALNYVSFAASSLVYGVFFAKRADVIYSYHPPLTVGISAALIGWFRRIPLVCDIQDMWPDSLKATGMINDSRVLDFVGGLCQWVYRRAAAIVVLSPGFKKLLIDRGVPAQKIEIIYNWADEQALTNPVGPAVSARPSADEFCILFAGNMGKAQALDSLLDAAALLQARESRVRFFMVGGGIDVERLTGRAVELALRNVVFLPPVPMSQVGAILSMAHILIVHLRDDPLFRITIPSKTQAYMAVGKPILMAVEGDAAELVLGSKGGVVVPPGNAVALADMAESLTRRSPAELERMGQDAKAYYEEHLSMRVGVRKFGVVFERCRRI